MRNLLCLGGTDAVSFVQGLVTNDVSRLSEGPVYAAMLTPQGKYLADFFVMARADGTIGLDVAAALCTPLQHRLTMYKLRADVTIELSPLHLHRGLGPTPDDGWADPRDAHLGWRAWRDTPAPEDDTNWDDLCVTHMVPQSGAELTPDSYILEMQFERLNGVDFRKGCYVGQEVTARMKHKTSLRKGLARVSVKGDPGAETEILANGKPVGQLHTRSGDQALAYLRFDRAEGEMSCGDAIIQRLS